MRIIVFSDTHRNISRMEKVLRSVFGVDAVIHCGDHLADMKDIAELFPKIRFFGVLGNCDADMGKYSEMIELSGKKLYITHGHMNSVKSEKEIDYPTITAEGRRLGADAVLFGHTHIPFNKNCGDIIVMNPGSIKYEGTYGVIEIEDGVMKSAICRLF